MKVLVTGAAGFIGSYVSLRLLEQGNEVVGLDNINDYYDPNLKYGRLNELGIKQENISWYKFTPSEKFSSFRFIRMNLEDTQAMQMLFANEGFDCVCNLAAQAGVRYSIQNPYAYVESNVDGFLNILEGCRHNQVKHLVYESSSSVRIERKSSLLGRRQHCPSSQFICCFEKVKRADGSCVQPSV